jgi:hypothetical protein
LAPSFEVSVPSLDTPFQVHFRAGAYILEHGRRSTLSRVALPAAFVQSVPPGPRRAAALQARLELVANIVSRTLTATESTYQTEQDEEVNTSLYKSSIFFQNVFKIRDTGGVHGPTYLADLLRDQSGEYVLPQSPSLVVGTEINLLAGRTASLRVRFAGVASPPLTVMLYGYTAQTLSFGVFRAELKGSFLLQKTTPNTGSISFEGSAELRKDGRKILDGSASGAIESSGGKPRLRLSVEASFHYEAETPPLLDRAAVLIANGDVDLTVVLGDHVSASATVSVSCTVNELVYPKVKRYRYFGGCLGGICVYYRQEYEEADFDAEPDVNTLVSASAEITCSVNSQTGHIRFKLKPPANPFFDEIDLGNSLPS